MALPHIIAPREFDTQINSVLDELNIEHDNTHFLAKNMLTESVIRPNYTQALDELDIWHEINMWSNDPILIYTAGTTTQELVNKLKNNKDIYNKLLIPLANNESQKTGIPVENIMMSFEDGPSELFIDMMDTIREESRLDRNTIL